MFDMVTQTPKEIFFTYIAIMAACALTYPILTLLGTAISRGVNRWK